MQKSVVFICPVFEETLQFWKQPVKNLYEKCSWGYIFVMPGIDYISMIAESDRIQELDKPLIDRKAKMSCDIYG